MADQTPNSVVFDIGNVLISWDPRNLYEKHIDDAHELDWFLEKVVTLEWHTHHDAGLSLQEGIEALSSQFPNHRDLISLFDTNWRETIKGEISETVGILKNLKSNGVPVFALSNYSKEKFPELGREFDFVSYFDDVVVSGEEGVVKPDPKIFQIAIERFNIDPQTSLFIDDRLDNIEAAKAQGFLGHHYKNPSALKSCLIDLGF